MCVCMCVCLCVVYGLVDGTLCSVFVLIDGYCMSGWLEGNG